MQADSVHHDLDARSILLLWVHLFPSPGFSLFCKEALNYCLIFFSPLYIFMAQPLPHSQSDLHVIP